MRWPDSLVERVLTTADALSARAKALAAELEHRTRMHAADQPLPGWETQQERHEEEAWRLQVGLELSQPPRVAAPSDFTARVMARIEIIQAQPLPPAVLPARVIQATLLTSPTLGPVPVVAGAIGISAMMALISGCLLAIFAPAQAMALLSAVLSAGVVLLTLVRAALGVTGSAASGVGVILLLAVVPLVVLVANGRGAWQSDRVAREA